MNKNKVVPTPPMGWNSYDYYATMVNEDQIKANAEYMAEHLKDYGWEYIVVDIQWYAYDAGSQRNKHQYIPFWKVAIDAYSRLLPCPDRFPSSSGGRGFKPLADFIHNLGLKFGIHIMRGIPRIAAHNYSGILGSSKTANEIAGYNSICQWNPDMYGIIPEEEGAQEYYNSIFDLYAQWGVDFIKCDDICRMDAPSAKQEIVMIHKAIAQCGRPMVLSLSPGPAKIEEAWHYNKYANMWRITDDFWDNWPLLLNMFERCELWQNHVSEGCFPDCDMLPLGYLGYGFGNERVTGFTRDEQITMMTLWCMFRSPLMIGTELTRLDDWTLGLLTNREVLRLIGYSVHAKQCQRDKSRAIWTAEDKEDSALYLAVFNLQSVPVNMNIIPEDCDMDGFTGKRFNELWTKETFTAKTDTLLIDVPPHSAKLFKIVRTA